VNALPTVNAVADQIVNNGAATAAINFTGTGNTFTWVNDTPGIGLAASGTGDIGSFMAVNSGSSPVTATITVTPVSNSYIYIASDTMSSAISVINAATNKIVDTIQVGNGPSTMLVNPKYNLLYVENTGLGLVSMISVINTVTNTVVNISDDVDGPSYGMALSPDGNKLYVASISGNQQTVVVFDAKTMGEISVMNLGISVAGIALSPDGQLLYLTGVNSGLVTVVNTTNNTVVNQITVGQLPWAAATNPNTGCVYVTNQGSNTVSVISIATNKVVATIPVGQSPSAISISRDGTMAYVANSNSNTISVIKCSNNQVIATISVGQSPSGTSFSTDGTKLYVVNKYDNTVSIIETGTNKVINTISVGMYPDSSGGFVSNGTGCSGAPVTFTITVNPTNDIPNQIVDNGQATTAVNFGGSGCTYNWTNNTPSIGLAPSGSGNIGSFKAVNNGTTPVVATITAIPLNVSYIYVANSTDNTITAIDANSNKVSKTIPVGINPVNLCVVPNGSKLYVANFGSNSISVIDCATNSVVATVSGLNSPNCVKASPDGTLVYVSNFQSNTISVISTSANQVVGQIPLSNAPLCICISPDGTTLYVSSYEEEFIYQLPSNKLIGSSGDAINWNFITLSKDANSMYGISYTDNFIGKAPIYNLAFAISGTSSPYAIAVGADPTQTYISNTNTNTVYEFDFNSYLITNTINVGKLPEGVFINADNSKVYVANSGSNTVSVIDTKTNLVVATIAVGNGPSYINGFATLGDGCTPATFTITVNPSPPNITAGTVTGTISACAGTASASPQIQQFTVSGSGLTGSITATAPAGFEVSLAAGSGYGGNVTIPQTAGTVSSTAVYVRAAATATTGSISGNVTLTSAGASNQTVAVSGIINPMTAASLVISPSGNDICAGTPVTFTAMPTNGGGAPTYQWLLNGVNTGTNSPTFSSSTLANGDVVSCMMTSSSACAVPATATSNSITMNVTPDVIPSINIAASQNTICAGTMVTFTATPVNGGSTPVYQWLVNGNNAGTNNSTFSGSSFADGDIVSCVMTSNAGCATPANATSNTITMSVGFLESPAISIAASQNNTCSGANITFTATPANGGSAPVYQWLLNGNNIGINSATFASSTLSNGDVIGCRLTSNATCLTIPNATSNSIAMIVNAQVAPAVSINISANNICAGTPVTFTASATNGGNSPVYQWLLNGANAGTNSPTFSSATFANGDVVSCVMASNLACVTPSNIASNSITMNIFPLPFVNGGGNKTIVKGSSIALTATATGDIADITWSPFTGLDNNKILNPKANPLSTTLYTITVQTAEGCTATDSVKVTVFDGISIPNTFTPNGDGVNDKWDIKNLIDYQNCEVRIFDRYGSEVYNSKGYYNAWDGTINGKRLPVGTYYYLINLNNGTRPLSGFVALIR